MQILIWHVESCRQVILKEVSLKLVRVLEPGCLVTKHWKVCVESKGEWNSLFCRFGVQYVVASLSKPTQLLAIIDWLTLHQASETFLSVGDASNSLCHFWIMCRHSVEAAGGRTKTLQLQWVSYSSVWWTELTDPSANSWQYAVIGSFDLFRLFLYWIFFFNLSQICYLQINQRNQKWNNSSFSRFSHFMIVAWKMCKSQVVGRLK